MRILSKCEQDAISPADLERGLQYIADSPSRIWGGFHPQLIQLATAALKEIHSLRTELRRLQGFNGCE